MHIVAALSWDPQLRGALILLTAILILPGSVFLILATNTGAKVGFLLAAAGLSGWLLVLNLIWLGYGIGYKGTQPSWVVKEIVTGDLVGHSTTKAVVGTVGDHATAFPNGWTRLPSGNPTLAQALPVADKALIPAAVGTTASSAFPPPFKTTQDYVDIAGFTKGGHNYLVNLFGYKIYWRVRRHFVYFKHQPHYLVVRVQPSLPSITTAGAAATLPAADASQPLTSVVMQRDVGSLRLPPILGALSSLIIFVVICERLHSREKEIARRKAEDEAGGGARSPNRELEPA
ncbi:MAG: hypothetical protein ACYDH6_02130 [Acidimicrobiales bacterium]